jgi:hypothetical protein
MGRGLVSTQSRAAGGGPSRPPMPATEMDFDVIFVGTLNYKQTINLSINHNSILIDSIIQ